MKTLVLLLAVVSLLVLPQMLLANHDGDQGGASLPAQQTRSSGEPSRCCKDGSSPWASQSKDAWQPNSNAGYQGSELPPSTGGYNPDHLDRYENPAYRTPQPPPSPAPAYGTSDLRFDPSHGLCGGSNGACGK